MSKFSGMTALILTAILIVGSLVGERILHLQGMLPLYGFLAILICVLVAICIVTYRGKATQ
jgi:hypothetical protein